MSEISPQQPFEIVDLRDASLLRQTMSPETREFALQAALFLGTHHRADVQVAAKESELDQALANPTASPEEVQRLKDELAFYRTAAILVPEKSDYTQSEEDM